MENTTIMRYDFTIPPSPSRNHRDVPKEGGLESAVFLTPFTFATTIPTKKIVNVPTTIIILLCRLLFTKLYSLLMLSLNVIHKITNTPIMVAVMAAAFFACRLISPSKNKPSIPPAKMPERFYQVSNKLLAPIIASPALKPIKPNTTVAICRVLNCCLSLMFLPKYFL